MIKYLELTRPGIGKYLVKIESINECWSDRSGGTVIRGFLVTESYDEIKSLIMSNERRACYDDDVDFRLKYLMRNSVWDIKKRWGNEKALRFMEELLQCNRAEEIHDLEDKYYRNETPGA